MENDILKYLIDGGSLRSYWLAVLTIIFLLDSKYDIMKKFLKKNGNNAPSKESVDMKTYSTYQLLVTEELGYLKLKIDKIDTRSEAMDNRITGILKTSNDIKRMFVSIRDPVRDLAVEHNKKYPGDNIQVPKID